MKTSFFPIDDSESKYTISLTAIEVPIEKYNIVRNELYNFSCGLIYEKGYVKNPPELHGAELLKGLEWATDEIRLNCFKKIVQIINENKLYVYRLGYYKKSVKIFLKSDPKLYSMNFFSVQRLMGHLSEEKLAIPIIDGLHEENSKFFNMGGQGLSILHSIDNEDKVSVKNFKNICEPLFASSKYSALIQLADMASYLLQSLDYKVLNVECGEFKRKIQNIAESFDKELIHNEIFYMRISE